MKLPLHTTSSPLMGSEARRVLKAVKAGRAVTNDKAKVFALKIADRLKAKRGGMVQKVGNA